MAHEKGPHRLVPSSVGTKRMVAEVRFMIPCVILRSVILQKGAVFADFIGQY